MSVPNSTVILFKNTNLRDSDGDYNTVYFSSAAKFKAWLMEGSQNPLTAPRYCKEFTNQMYKKEGEGILKVNATMEELYGVDYMYYTNTGYENITYFCFVDRIEYINDATVAIHYHEDTWQTWIRVLDVKRGICDRKIIPVANDAKYTELNEVPDYTANADLKQYSSVDVLAGETEGKWIVAVTNEPIYVAVESGGTSGIFDVIPASVRPRYMDINDGRPDCVFYYVVRANYNDVWNLLWIRGLIENSRTGGLTSSGYDILSLSIVAKSCIPTYIQTNCNSDSAIGVIVPDPTQSAGDHLNGIWPAQGNHAYDVYRTHYERGLVAEEQYVSETTLNTGAFGGYVPKNLKMYSAPYITYRLKNNYGAYMDLNPNHITWYTGQARFTVKTALAPANTPSCYVDYDNITENTNTRVSGSPCPDMPYTLDTFKQWAAQNRVAIGTNLAKGALGTIALLTGIPAGAIAGISTSTAAGVAGASSLASMFAQMNQVTAKGPSVAGDISGMSPRNENLDHFSVDTLTVSYDTAKNIDDMFSMFGYSIGHMDKFEWQGILNGRQFWTYYKAKDAHVKEDNALAPVPAYAKRRIEAILNNGIRIWRRDYIFNYENDNTTTPTPSVFDD